MKFKKYKFRKYRKSYLRFFQMEKKKLKKIFPNAKVEHIGSTAIEGLGGKGIIDLQLGIIKSQVKNSINKLKENKYNLIEVGGDNKERWFFQKDYCSLGGIRRVQVHLTILDSFTWKKCVKFRDILKKDKRLCEKYSKLKKDAIGKGLKNDGYRDYKRKFIEEALRG